MTTWHDRLQTALTARGYDWPDLVKATKLAKPSVYAWKPTATKQTKVLDGSNAAVVCSFLRIRIEWLMNGVEPSGLSPLSDTNAAISTLKDRLKDARKEAGFSQADLAKLAGCGQTTIASIENGRNQGSTVLARLAEILKVEPLWLAEGKGCKKIGVGESLGQNVEPLKPKSAHDARVDEIVLLLRRTSMEGLAVILDRAKDAARDYPIVKQTRAS